ncbi:ABC-2 type transport system ATP-binding protein [Trichlorobacter thiogenes]|uniref:ABC-2 type transport system ATP-binding protein n=1 Tax=Trichlorobacter thiogenes TaxID=115783 RepID=A0A1T4SA80_9BACT|nr:ABC transporter ATP-binding protein [Trichlorobacter thiogenes]SKA25230.1 ABC-2 type transport system ATP-binding protein [Trichlorobacter thiogenes]
MIIFEDVCKTFQLERGKKVSAVQCLSLVVASGEVFGCIGPNGAGKSTTIKLLLDLIRPDSGTITINSLPSRDNASRARVGYLPENPCQYDFLTAHEYLAYSGNLSGLSSSIIAERSSLLLEKLKLSQAANRRISGYSKGMQQRTAIAAALIHNPDLVVLDEPMSGLDPLGRKLIFDLIAELKEQGKTVFISSHVLTDIERLCDRVGIIVQGRLCHEGQVSDLTMPLEELFLQVVADTGLDEVK